MNIARVLRPKIYKNEMKLINLNEDELVKKILDGELVFDKGYINKFAPSGYISKGGVFKLYVEYAPFFYVSYFIVNGIDRNYEIRDGEKCWANYARLFNAISNKMEL
jgi:hypothetical protein